MSSTNRGTSRQREDYYRTPSWAINDFLAAFQQDNEFAPNKLYNCSVLEPCAGGDPINPEMPYAKALQNVWFQPKAIFTNDIRIDSPAETRGDYLIGRWSDLADVIITNPPFSIAEEVIKKALSDVRDNGYVIMLLRLNFFGSKRRKAWLQSTMPTFCYVHSRRLGFTNNGKSTDSIEYAHFVWQKGNYPRFTATRII